MMVCTRENADRQQTMKGIVGLIEKRRVEKILLQIPYARH